MIEIKMNLNSLAKIITEMEGGKVPLNIAQVKEVIRCTQVYLAAEYGIKIVGLSKPKK